MRKLFAFFYIACIFLALVFLAAPPGIVWIAKKSIADAFPGGQADITACRLWPPGTCTLSGIAIQKAGVYRITIPSITALLSVDGSIRIPDFQIGVLTGNGRIQAAAAFLLRRWGREIDEISLNIPMLQYAGVTVANASVNAAAGRSGKLAVEKLSAGKLSVRDITGDTELSGNSIRFENVAARLFDGSVKGSCSVALRAGISYQATLAVSLVDMAAAVSGFGLTRKVELSGRAGGVATIHGSASQAARISGYLNSAPPGGVLNIRDQAVIDMIAERSGQARDLISRSFTDYQYDQAKARVYTQENKLVLDIDFQGAGGKRTLQVVLHDFTVQGGGS